MKLPKTLPPLLLALSASTMTTAQLLTQGNGNLPSCASSCSILTNAQTQCGSNWNCFCTTVWANSNHALTTMCASACTSATDNSAINTWYTANCGSDNGASEHGGSGVASSSANAATSTSTTNSGGTSASGPNDVDQGQPTWWDGHWKWIIMVIVLFFGLLLLALLGRWLKKRHDRKQDQIREGFNAGITARSGPQRREKEKNATDNRMSTAADDYDGNTAGSGRDSPARTRDAFMPYGYGYTRSESRLASHDRASPLVRGSTPMGEMEKEIGVEEPAPVRKKEKGGRKVLVREKSGRSDEGEIRRAR